jgi:hypothetical protein
VRKSGGVSTPCLKEPGIALIPLRLQCQARPPSRNASGIEDWSGGGIGGIARLASRPALRSSRSQPPPTERRFTASSCQHKVGSGVRAKATHNPVSSWWKAIGDQRRPQDAPCCGILGRRQTGEIRSRRPQRIRDGFGEVKAVVTSSQASPCSGRTPGRGAELAKPHPAHLPPLHLRVRNWTCIASAIALPNTATTMSCRPRLPRRNATWLPSLFLPRSESTAPN